MSKNIVIAGPGGLAQHFLDILLPNPAYKLTVLTRSAKPALAARGVAVAVVDYESEEALTGAIRAAGADTVVSFLTNYEDPDAQARAQRNLLRASLAAGGVRRFLPSEFANNVRDFPDPAGGEKDKKLFREFLRAEAAAAGLEFSFVCCGLISDFLLPRDRRPKQHFPEFPGPVDAEKRLVYVLGDEKATISTTAADDVARATERLLAAPLGSWPEYSFVTGDRVSYLQIADALERVTGDKVERVFLPMPALEKQLEEALGSDDVMAIVGAELFIFFGNGSTNMPEDNAKIFDGINFTKVEDLFQYAYGKK